MRLSARATARNRGGPSRPRSVRMRSRGNVGLVSGVVAWPFDLGPVADLTEASARQTLAGACRAVGLDPVDARMLRLGEHAMFRLAAPIVVRIARSSASEPDARMEVSVARWLQGVDYPAVRALPIDQPLLHDSRVVTFWRALSDDGTEFGTTAEVADLLVKLHALRPPCSLALAGLRPFARVARRIDSALWLSPDDREFLRARREQLAQQYDQLTFVLPLGVIHRGCQRGATSSATLQVRPS
jgi:hypothetical protein